METSKGNKPAASEVMRELASKPPFVRHEMDELVQRLANSGDQELITLGRNLKQSRAISK